MRRHRRRDGTDTATSGSATDRRPAAMLIEIRLLARLFRIPLLRVEGVIALRDVDAQHTSMTSAAGQRWMIDTMPTNVRGGAADRAALGRDLAEAEAIISGIDRSGSQPTSRAESGRYRHTALCASCAASSPS